MDLKSIQLEYHQKELTQDSLASCPLVELKKWMNDVLKENITYPNAVTLTTVDSKMNLSSRIVLIKDINEKGLVFFTNYESKKAKAIDENPNVYLSFFWKELDRQIRIEATASKVSYEESNKYFKSRPRLSQVSAMASPQSESISKEQLQANFEKYHAKEEELECPLNWGGYLLVIKSAEFWQGRPNRLHDRFNYTYNGKSWNINRLAP